MKELLIEDIKKYELEILLNFDAFCQDNGLRYYLAGGTLLGAIRHKGFIPWDDDIDVCMPRNDYIKLISLSSVFHQQYPQLKIKSNALNNIEVPFSKIVNINTIIEYQYIENPLDIHLWIDIFPIDGLPDDINKVEEIYRRCNLYRKILILIDAKLGEGTDLFRKYIKYILVPFAKLFGKQRCICCIENIAKQYSYETSKYVGAVTWGLYGVGERMLKNEFEKMVYVDFEGYRLSAFSCWDSYLRGLYGNYMQLPSAEKRKPHHNFKAYCK